MFPNDVTLFYVTEIICALDAVHKRSFAYRDLKPENLMLDSKGHVKLADFGFAKQLGGRKTFSICGTPEYLAPEIILSLGHDQNVDWWALGILTFELLCGFPPFFDESPMQIYKKITTC